MIFALATLGQIKSPKLWCQTCTSCPRVFLLEYTESGAWQISSATPDLHPLWKCLCFGFKYPSHKFLQPCVCHVKGSLEVHCGLSRLRNRPEGSGVLKKCFGKRARSALVRPCLGGCESDDWWVYFLLGAWAKTEALGLWGWRGSYRSSRWTWYLL